MFFVQWQNAYSRLKTKNQHWFFWEHLLIFFVLMFVIIVCD